MHKQTELDIEALRKREELKRNVMKGDAINMPNISEIKKFTVTTRFTNRVHELGREIIGENYQVQDSSRMIIQCVKANQKLKEVNDEAKLLH